MVGSTTWLHDYLVKDRPMKVVKRERRKKSALCFFFLLQHLDHLFFFFFHIFADSATRKYHKNASLEFYFIPLGGKRSLFVHFRSFITLYKNKSEKKTRVRD